MATRLSPARGSLRRSGVKGHFPPGIMFTPQVDLYDIESTNRDSISPTTHTRFNVPSILATVITLPSERNLVAPGIVRSGHRNVADGPGAWDRDVAGRYSSIQRAACRIIRRGRRHWRFLPGHDGVCHRGELEAQHAAGA